MKNLPIKNALLLVSCIAVIICSTASYANENPIKAMLEHMEVSSGQSNDTESRDNRA